MRKYFEFQNSAQYIGDPLTGTLFNVLLTSVNRHTDSTPGDLPVILKSIDSNKIRVQTQVFWTSDDRSLKENKENPFLYGIKANKKMFLVNRSLTQNWIWAINTFKLYFLTYTPRSQI